MCAIPRDMVVGRGDEVICPAIPAVMDVNHVMYLGAKSVYVDVDQATYNMDMHLLEAKTAFRTRTIVAQHTCGYRRASRSRSG